MKKAQHLLGFFHIQSTELYYLAIPANVQHSTWLGEPMAARSACNTAMGERPGALSARRLGQACATKDEAFSFVFRYSAFPHAPQPSTALYLIARFAR
jgi:hypothetical protein